MRGHVVPQLRLLSANAEHLAPRARPGPLDHAEYKKPWPEATLPRHAGVVSFRLRGGLPRGVAVLCDRRPMLSCICTPARRIPRRPSNLTCAAVPHSKRKHLLHLISSTTVSTIPAQSVEIARVAHLAYDDLPHSQCTSTALTATAGDTIPPTAITRSQTPLPTARPLHARTLLRTPPRDHWTPTTPLRTLAAG